MLDELRFAQGGVAKKDFLPELTHFHIADGRIMGYNGVIAVSCPIPLDIMCSPKGEPLVRAIMACKDADVTRLSLTPTGRLSVKSGKFRAVVECLPDMERPAINITGRRVDLPETFVPLLKKLKPFIAEDASRNWAKGIMFRRGCLYATNNLVMLQAWAGIDAYADIPEFNIPEITVNELLRIKERPTHLNVTENCVTFHFAGNKWLWSTLYDSTWPEVDALLDGGKMSDAAMTLDTAFQDALDTLKPFLADDMRVILRNNTLTTHAADEQGAAIEFPLPQDINAAYNHTQLRLVAAVAQKLDVTPYPKPAVISAPDIRGVLTGMHLNAS